MAPPRRRACLFDLILPTRGCWQPTTIPQLIEKSVRAFCWISPGEHFADAGISPSKGNSLWEFGAFLYMRNLDDHTTDTEMYFCRVNPFNNTSAEQYLPASLRRTLIAGMSFGPILLTNAETARLEGLPKSPALLLGRNGRYSVSDEIRGLLCDDSNFGSLADHGVVAPAEKLSWDTQTREAFKIPANATHFAFAYPLAGFSEEAAKRKVELNDSTDRCLYFVGIGGFLFWDAAGAAPRAYIPYTPVSRAENSSRFHPHRRLRSDSIRPRGGSAAGGVSHAAVRTRRSPTRLVVRTF